ncbi:uncharacterized protein LTR77_003227 [Saxophila tyrrhenica]|uniref:Uncharacterized protein n=1 Tax=Saxophila tyrrhenica TaxID=1690608 RepID=A0AAV9PKE3_9PEZI|nr:hypothetical protein LTR77_003227 [Saxophila tyrrhenica]
MEGTKNTTEADPQTEEDIIQAVMDKLPSSLSNQSRLFYWKVEMARSAYRKDDFESCKAQCQELLQQAFLPDYARVKTLHLICGVVSLSEADRYLEQALKLCQDIEKTDGKAAVQWYFDKTAEIQEWLKTKASDEASTDDPTVHPDGEQSVSDTKGTGTAESSTQP